MAAAAGTPFSNTYGPLVITGTPSTTSQSIFVSVAINGSVVTQNNLTPQAPNLIWTNLQVGSETTSGNVSAFFATGTDTNSLNANTLSWSSPRGGSGSASGQVGQW